MFKRIAYSVLAIVVIAAAVVVASGGLDRRLAVRAEDAPTSAVPMRTITVVGDGSISVEPDMAQINIGVETTGDSVKLATNEADEIVLDIMAAMKALGIEQKDMQTSGFSVWKDRNSEPMMLSGAKTESEAVDIYRVNNTVNITIRDLELVSTVIDAAIDEGANNIHGIRFSVSDPEPLESKVRAKAIENAIAKAAELAELNDVEVGQVLAISEVIGGTGGYLDSNFMRLESAKVGMGGGAITPGELELSAKIQVTYAIQ